MAIGAHPDDCEFRCGGVAALWAQRGDAVCFVSMTNGQSGHHEMNVAALSQRRAAEAARAAAAVGAESRVLPIADGHLEATLQNRLMLIRLIREFRPDLILTHRPNDYHPDHRYTAMLVQDSAFMLTVPQVAPEAPALRTNPVILYWADTFQKPTAFAADIAIDIDAVLDRKLQSLHQHESQVYEWLPWLDGILDQVPADEPDRLKFLRQWYEKNDKPPADAFRKLLVARYGQQRGNAVRTAEAFEVCEYGSPLMEDKTKQFFGGL